MLGEADKRPARLTMTVKYDSKLKVITAGYRHGAAGHDSKFYRHDSKDDIGWFAWEKTDNFP